LAAVAAWGFSAAAALLSFHIEPKLIAAIFFGGAMVTSIYGLVNASWLRVTRLTVKLANLPADWRGGTLALVADLHLGNGRGTRFTRRVVAKLQQLQPDAVLISGDLFDGSKADLDALLEPWKGLSAPAGVYYVTGNHEEFTDRSQYLDAVERAGIRVLNNEKVEISGLQIVGVHDAELHDPPLFRAVLQGAKLDRNRPGILLAHQPLNLSIPEEEGVSLQLSGHRVGSNPLASFQFLRMASMRPKSSPTEHAQQVVELFRAPASVGCCCPGAAKMPVLRQRHDFHFFVVQNPDPGALHGIEISGPVG
jgi:hypothetical protein